MEEAETLLPLSGVVWSGGLPLRCGKTEPQESRKPTREALSPCRASDGSLLLRGLHQAEVWSLGLRGLGCTKGSSAPCATSPSCSWSTSNLEVLCCAQRPPPPPLPTTASKQDHAVVAEVTSDAPGLQPSAGRQMSGKKGLLLGVWLPPGQAPLFPRSLLIQYGHLIGC